MGPALPPLPTVLASALAVAGALGLLGRGWLCGAPVPASDSVPAEDDHDTGEAPLLAVGGLGDEPALDLAARPWSPRATVPLVPSSVADELPQEEPGPTGRSIPFTLAIVDAETGHPVPGARWRLEGTADPERRGDGEDASPLACDAETGRFSVEWSTQVPDGFAGDAKRERSGIVARWTRRLIAVHPLRREVPFEVQVVTEDGAPAQDAEVLVSTSDFLQKTPWVPGTGAIVVRGVPFYRGAKWMVRVEACQEEETYRGVERGEMPYFAAEPIFACVTLPATPTREVRHGGFYSHCSGTGCGMSVHRGEPTGEARILVRRRDGTPATQARVRIDGGPWGRYCGGRDRLDAEGRITLERMEPGSHILALLEPGLVPFSTTFTVREGETTDVVATEPEGGEVELIVVDDQGRPLPFASFGIQLPSRVDWLDVSGDTQRIDAFTNVLGRRTLPHVEPGAVAIKATYGGRRGEASVRVDEGGRTVARIEVR